LRKIAQVLFSLACLTLSTHGVAQYRTADPADENDPYATRYWEEAEVTLPTNPPSKDLRPFYVSPSTPNTFAIDAKSLTFGKDEVHRYIIVITTPTGAKQITYEGIRCEKGEWRLYASMQSDGKWVKSPSSRWLPIQYNNYNRYHSALYQDAFCESGIARRKTEDILRLLKP